MSELRKANTDYPYFLTFTIVGWIDVFTREMYCESVIRSLKYCIENKGLELYGYVIMPSHVHLIVRHNEGRLAAIIRDCKSFLAKEIIGLIESEPGESRKEWLLHMLSYYAKFEKQNSQYMFWQKTNHPVELSTPSIFNQKVDYIHLNPVASGYVADETCWKYSSANAFSILKVLESY